MPKIGVKIMFFIENVYPAFNWNLKSEININIFIWKILHQVHKQPFKQHMLIDFLPLFTDSNIFEL